MGCSTVQVLAEGIREQIPNACNTLGKALLAATL